MTVGNLIYKLQTLNPDSELLFTSDSERGRGSGFSIGEFSGISKYTKEKFLDDCYVEIPEVVDVYFEDEVKEYSLIHISSEEYGSE